MNQNSDDVPGPEPIVPFAEATAYLEKFGVAAIGFPSDRLERLQLLLTTEPNAGCRVWPDPTWDPVECQEACDEHWLELDHLKAYIEAFRRGGVALAESTIAALEQTANTAKQLKEAEISKRNQSFRDSVAKYASSDHRTATEMALDCYREHVRQTNAQKAEHPPTHVQPEPGKDGSPV